MNYLKLDLRKSDVNVAPKLSHWVSVVIHTLLAKAEPKSVSNVNVVDIHSNYYANKRGANFQVNTSVERQLMIAGNAW